MSSVPWKPKQLIRNKADQVNVKDVLPQHCFLCGLSYLVGIKFVLQKVTIEIWKQSFILRMFIPSARDYLLGHLVNSSLAGLCNVEIFWITNMNIPAINSAWYVCISDVSDSNTITQISLQYMVHCRCKQAKAYPSTFKSETFLVLLKYSVPNDTCITRQQKATQCVDDWGFCKRGVYLCITIRLVYNARPGIVYLFITRKHWFVHTEAWYKSLVF